MSEKGVRALEEAEVPEQVSKEDEQRAVQRASERARTARWDLNIAIFLFAVLIIIIILLFQGISLEVVAPIAAAGLVMVWLTGWRQGRQLYERFLEEELTRLEFKRSRKMEETIEEVVQRALRERWR